MNKKGALQGPLFCGRMALLGQDKGDDHVASDGVFLVGLRSVLSPLLSPLLSVASQPRWYYHLEEIEAATSPEYA